MTVSASLHYFLPETCLLTGAFALLLLDLFVRNKKVIGGLALVVLAASFLLALPAAGNHALFSGLFYLDPLTYFFRLLALGIVAVWILLSLDYAELEPQVAGEYYVLALFMAFGLILMAASINLLMLFLSIEFVSILSYLLTGFEKKNLRSKEASVKYLLFGSVASGIMLYGISLLFGAAGSLELGAIAAKLSREPSFYTLALTGSMLLVTGIGFKISMAPFHLWAPDVYEGAPTPVTAFLTVGPKALGFAVMLRVLNGAFQWFHFEWSHTIVLLSILTMTIGNVSAVAQTNVKRLLAYSSIAQAGYMLMGIAVSSKVGLNAVLFYLLSYTFTNLGAFAVATAVAANTHSYELESYKGLAKRAPGLAACMVLFLLSLAGIPPLAGFFGKFYVFSGALESRYYVLAVSAAVNSAVAAFYYFKIVRQMYLTPSVETSPIPCALPLRLTVYLLVAGILVIGFFPSPFITYFQSILAF